jgi:hypothetical protein
MIPKKKGIPGFTDFKRVDGKQRTFWRLSTVRSVGFAESARFYFIFYPLFHGHHRLARDEKMQIGNYEKASIRSCVASLIVTRQFASRVEPVVYLVGLCRWEYADVRTGIDRPQ